MTDQEARSILLFFFFSVLDDRKATDATHSAASLLKKSKKQNPGWSSSMHLVYATNTVWEKIRKKVVRGQSSYSLHMGWQIPLNIDFGPWKEFQKVSPEEEMLAVIWSQLLLISDSDIAIGLGTTRGSVRYRVARGLKKLGAYNQMGRRGLEVTQ